MTLWLPPARAWKGPSISDIASRLLSPGHYLLATVSIYQPAPPPPPPLRPPPTPPNPPPNPPPPPKPPPKGPTPLFHPPPPPMNGPPHHQPPPRRRPPRSREAIAFSTMK